MLDLKWLKYDVKDKDIFIYSCKEVFKCMLFVGKLLGFLLLMLAASGSVVLVAIGIHMWTGSAVLTVIGTIVYTWVAVTIVVFLQTKYERYNRRKWYE